MEKCTKDLMVRPGNGIYHSCFITHPSYSYMSYLTSGEVGKYSFPMGQERENCISEHLCHIF